MKLNIFRKLLFVMMNIDLNVDFFFVLDVGMGLFLVNEYGGFCVIMVLFFVMLVLVCLCGWWYWFLMMRGR